jgi:hypothetical protein
MTPFLITPPTDGSFSYSQTIEKAAQDHFSHAFVMPMIFGNMLPCTDWCEDNLGRDAIYFEAGQHNFYTCDPSREWTYVYRTFYFKNDEDLLAFRMAFT